MTFRRGAAIVVVLAACATTLPETDAPITLHTDSRQPGVLREVQLEGAVGHGGSTPTVVLRELPSRVAGVIVTAHSQRIDSTADAVLRTADRELYGCEYWEEGRAFFGPAWICRIPLAPEPRWRTYLAEVDTFLMRTPPARDSSQDLRVTYDSTGQQRFSGTECMGGLHWSITSRAGGEQVARSSVRGVGPNCWTDTPEARAYNQEGWDLLKRGLSRMARDPSRSVQQ